MTLENQVNKTSGKKRRNISVATATAAMIAAQAAFVSYAATESQAQDCPSCPPTPSPFVTSTVPADGQTGVDRDANIKAKFSEKMLKSSVNGETVNLYEGNLTYDDLNPTSATPPPEVSASVSYNAKKKRAALNPSARLKANTEYTTVVEGAGDSDGLAVKDRENNEMFTDEIWHFTTGTS